MSTRICFFCEKEFSKPPSVKSKYCSWECFQKGLLRGDSRKGKNLICSICRKLFYVPPNRIDTARYCSYRCHQIGEGRKGGAVRAEQMKQKSKGKSYPKTNGKHTHRVVMESVIGRPLLSDEIVHHKNNKRIDNDQHNLELLKNQSEHIKMHISDMLKKRKAKHGY